MVATTKHNKFMQLMAIHGAIAIGNHNKHDAAAHSLFHSHSLAVSIQATANESLHMEIC